MICPRCKREAKGWPVYRADVCSPSDWVSCIREPVNILRAQALKQAHKPATVSVASAQLDASGEAHTR